MEKRIAEFERRMDNIEKELTRITDQFQSENVVDAIADGAHDAFVGTKRENDPYKSERIDRINKTFPPIEIIMDGGSTKMLLDGKDVTHMVRGYQIEHTSGCVIPSVVVRFNAQVHFRADERVKVHQIIPPDLDVL